MNTSQRATSVLAALVMTTGALALTSSVASADLTAQSLPLAQNWTDAGLITTNDDWAGVPGIIGYRGDDVTSVTGADPQTLLTDGTLTVDVNANQANPATFATGGVAEFAITDPVVALQGSGTADAPNVVATITTAGLVDIGVSYSVRDVDASIDDAVQAVALQYRVGTTGTFTNVPAAFVADATTGPNVATLVTPVAATLPPDAAGQSVIQVRIITSNAAGSDEWVGIDDISITGTPGGGGPAAPVATCPAAITTAAGAPGGADVSATDADSAIASIAITSPTVDGISILPGVPGTARLDVAGTTAAGTYDVTIEFATDDDPAQLVSCTIVVTVLPVVVISAVQGSGPASPLLGEEVLIRGIVTSTYTANDALSGFFVQEEDADADADARTSEGLFVDCGGACPPGATAGDQVQVAGVVIEDFAMTQIRAATAGSVIIVSSGNASPTAAVIDLPASGRTDDAATFEPVEGMLTMFADMLSVTEYFELARFGQLELIAGGRPYQFTHQAAPSAAGNAAHLAEQATRRIILDDDNDDQNDAITGPAVEGYPYPSPGLSTTNRFRGGDTVTGLTGALEWSFGAWRIRPVPDVAYTFTPANPAPSAPSAPGDLGGDLRVASFNVLNYFATIDTTSSNNAGPCGPSGTLDCRGADSPAELAQQRAKIVSALAALDADVVGLVELQNDAGAAVTDLVTALNARPGAAPYAFVDTGPIGGDAIKVAFIYRPSAITPVGAFEILDSTVDPRFIDTRNRPALIQTFAETSTGERFTAAINHFKSKGSACTTNDPALLDDPDLGDGQGNCSVTRTHAADALADFLATDPTGSGDPDVVILGDLNSYRRELPITTLVHAGYVDLVERFVGAEAYSFVFDGQLGYLDHALATESLTEQVTGAAEWHVNADEPPLFDYNDDLRDAGEAAFERESTAADLDLADARRSSDHDPVVVGLDLSSLDVDSAVIVQNARGGGSLAFSADVNGTFVACPRLKVTVEGVEAFSGPTVRLVRTNLCASLTRKGLVTFDLPTRRITAALTLPRPFRLTDDTVTFAVAVNDVLYTQERAGRRSGLVWRAI